MSGTLNPGKPPNAAGQGGTVNPARNRKGGAGNPQPKACVRTATDISTKLRRIAELAKGSPQVAFTSLAHLIDVGWLEEAYDWTRKDGAVGVDGQTAADYAANLRGNLESLLERAKSGRYRAPPVRRVHIPKGSGPETRPIGIPTFEDKVLQRAVAMVLELIYEQDFMDCSYGFRPGRSAHQALGSLWKQAMNMGGCWLIEVDIRKFFDTLDHGHLREILRQRVRDGVILRLIGKWLNAGVLESGTLSFPDKGTPQGGVISPLLANVYLHAVLDKWFEYEVKPRLRGRGFLIRYADDAVIGFTAEKDAREVLALLPERFGRYGLALHPDKTRLVDFRQPAARKGDPPPPVSGVHRTFDLLGFTHFWARSRKGFWMVTRKTARNRFARSLKAISAWCRQNRHERPRDQHGILCAKFRGHVAYYGITNNWRSLARFRHAVTRIWRYWLDRRSQKARMTWLKMNRLLERYPLPPPRILHRI